jgi:L-ascorbate metabolism protein UlaG (beta-lactamase superfamily)
MKVKWLGHSAFLITSESGIRIITDPYKTDDMLTYGKIEETADIVTVSHEHGDHNNVAAVRGKPQVIRKTSEAKGIKFRGVATSHDDSGGSRRGSNTIFCFTVDGLNICHLGDLGHPLSDKQITEIGKVDVLLIPVGGSFTIDAKTAGQICDRLKPKVVMPMHYKTEKCNLPLEGVSEFVHGRDNVIRLDANEVEFKADNLPAGMQITVLKSAL